MTKRLLNITIKTTIALLIVTVALLWYAGFFNTVYISETESGSFNAIVTNTGYFDDPVEARNTLFHRLHNKGIISGRAVAITPVPFGENLITRTGWLLTPDEVRKVIDLTPPYQLITIPEKERIVADFAYDNSFSIMAGALIVYRRLEKYCNEKGYTAGTMYEVYDDKQQRIFYHLDINKAKTPSP